MADFKDARGREWNIDLNVWQIKRVRELAKVDLCEALTGTDGLFIRLSRDAVMLADVIYALCRSKAEQLKISEEDFYRGLFGDGLGNATKALLEALVFFQPNPADRENLKAWMLKVQEATDLAGVMAKQRVSELSPEVIVSQFTQPTSGVSSTPAPAPVD